MFIKRLTVLLYVTIIMFLGCGIALFALHVVKFNEVFLFAYATYHDRDLRLIVGILGGVILLSNFFFYKYFSVNVHRDKIIAFDNPSGRVSVSLVAMEDLIRRLVLKSPEIKDVRVKITARKKGLDVRTRLVLRSESRIPDMTANIQERIKRKIQDTIGLEEPVDVSIYVGKILGEKQKSRAVVEPSDEADDTMPPEVPFRGFRK
jgi:uncharacterized alkaline shock family protein YloU